ncbi:DUF3089 domain-containing protein [Niveispirillum irakense]|uniref:DUF3089 domain-containing protein n=1 Tax=Niveispirillum irakense TaxID=34011 RepID=UPI00042341C2|nr:DUF3089 domain-containing protein [Niveispirillum irakense]
MRQTVFLATAILLGTAFPAAAAGGAPPSFAQQPPPPVPDYANPSAWAARPTAPGASAALPTGADTTRPAAEIDVFYVHPTTYRSKDRWNQDIADQATNAWTDASVIARQAGVFNGCCRVYAPRYRQASSLSFMAMEGDGGKAFDLAYEDVKSAFDYYLKHENQGRPFILAGHSQGARHLMHLLEDRIDGTPLAREMVAAYIVGVNLSEGDFPKTYKTISICDEPDQTRCVIAWNAVLPEFNIAMMAAAGERRYVERYGDDPGKRALCINPVTFDRAKPVSTAEQALGAVPGEPGEGPMQPLRAKAVGARCEQGYLVVEPAADLDLTSLPGGSMHYHDYGLFYADIRANIRVRIDNFLKAKP